MSTRFARPALRFLTASVLLGFVSVALAGPVGYLQINGRITVQPDGADSPLRMSENDYAVFSNDRINTVQGSAVLVLNGGGVIGLSESSSARVQQSEQSSDLTVILESGSVVYSIPSDAGNLRIDVDGVRFAAVPASTPAASSSARLGEVAGTLSVDENRQVNALARAGDIRVLRANGSGQALAGAAAPASANSIAYTDSSNAGRPALAAQSYDTLTSVSEGNGVQVQTGGKGGAAAISLMSGATSQAGLTGAEAGAGADGSSKAPGSGNGNVALVESAQGSTWVVIDEEDEEIQSLSP